MKKIIGYLLFFCLIELGSSSIAAPFNTINDPLPSWNNGLVKRNIIQFVNEVTDKTNSAYVPEKNRIATFDNDGTMWVEKPIYTQVFFMLDRIKQLAPQHPEWKTQEPFKAILTHDIYAMKNFKTPDFVRIMAATSSDMSIEKYNKLVESWLTTAKSPRFNVPFTSLVYQPMLEVMNYLRKNNFKIYIVTGGDQSFVRAFSEKIYGVPLNQVIGSTQKTNYVYIHKTPQLIRAPEILFIDDKTGKPSAIHLFIGQKPIIAFGNSDGDQQMLEWTQSGPGKRLMLLVHHDDTVREYAYGAESKVGTFSASLMKEARERKWNIISMKNDWKRIFKFQHQ